MTNIVNNARVKEMIEESMKDVGGKIMNKVIYISSINDLIKRTTQIHKNFEKLPISTFYRGDQMNHDEVKPSIYYDDNFIKNEDTMFKESILYNPDEFEYEKTTFEKLVKMQHYGLPTRLLDVTSNPLIALYFACSGKEEDKEDTPQLIVIGVPDEKLKFYDSDTVSVVSNISRRPYNGLNISQYEKRLGEPNEEFINRFNKCKDIKYLIHEIKNEKPYFQSIIEKKDMETIWCVKPLLKNKRIIRQQGAFLLFGIEGDCKGCPKLKKVGMASMMKEIVYTKFSIEKGKKKEILKQLDILGISETTLMPEIDNISKELKRKYSKGFNI